MMAINQKITLISTAVQFTIFTYQCVIGEAEIIYILQQQH